MPGYATLKWPTLQVVIVAIVLCSCKGSSRDSPFSCRSRGQQESACRKRNDATTLCTSNRSFGHRPLSGWSRGQQGSAQNGWWVNATTLGSSRWPSWHRPPSGWSWGQPGSAKITWRIYTFSPRSVKGAPWCCSVASWIRLRDWQNDPKGSNCLRCGIGMQPRGSCWLPGFIWGNRAPQEDSEKERHAVTISGWQSANDWDFVALASKHGLEGLEL